MKEIIVFKRRGYSTDALNHLKEKLATLGDYTLRTWQHGNNYSFKRERDLYIRWGYGGNIPALYTGPKWVNGRRVNTDKVLVRLAAARKGFCALPLEVFGSICEDSIRNVFGPGCEDRDFILRPRHHQGGNHYRVVKGTVEDFNSAAQSLMHETGMTSYAAPVFPKTREFRVFVMHGRVINVYEKFPGNPGDMVWNHEQGGTVKNVRFSEWPIDICLKSIQFCVQSYRDFTCVDWMMDAEGNSSFLEINQSPALEGEYRTTCVAKGLVHYMENDYKTYSLRGINITDWKDLVHPAIWSPTNDSDV